MTVVIYEDVGGVLESVVCDWVDFNDSAGLTYCHYNSKRDTVVLVTDSVREISALKI